MRRRVLIATRTFGSTSAEPWELLDASGCDTVRLDVTVATDDEFAAAFVDVDAAIVGSRPISATTMQAATALRVIAMHGVGLDHIDRDAARARGIVLANAPGSNSASVADLAFGLLLAVARQIPAQAAAVREGGWTSALGTELHRKTIGLVGFGKIGQGVASRARGFDMPVLVFDPYAPKSAFSEFDAEHVTLEDLFARADIVSLHAPATAETQHLVNRDRLASMKPTAILINTARGDLVDEIALAEALRSGVIAGAGLDTFEQEPPTGNALLGLSNVVATPHVGAHTREAVARASVMAARNVVDVLEGRVATWAVP